MGARVERQSSGKGWLCCFSPAVVEESAAAPAAVSSAHGGDPVADKISHSQGAHVTATAHCTTVADLSSSPTDIAPVGSDQQHKQTADSEPGPASAAAAGSIAAVMAAKISSHNKQQDSAVHARYTPHPDLKHLLASSHARPYTDADWDASMDAVEQIQQQNQALALAQLQAASGQKQLTRDSYGSGNSDAWHDAFSHTMSDASAASEAEQKEVEQYLAELEMLRGCAPAPGRELAITPTCVPDPPLLFAPKHWKYCQVEPKQFCAYWERDSLRSTPFPLPIDVQMRLSKLALRCHESIPGMWLRMEGHQLVLTATPNIIAIPGVMNYHEYYNSDSTASHWALRRDISLGRSEGQMFMTTDGILVFRVFSSGLFSKTVDWVSEDYMRVEDNGNVIITKQWSRRTDDGSVRSQYLIGRKTGPNPPPKGHRHHH